MKRRRRIYMKEFSFLKHIYIYICSAVLKRDSCTLFVQEVYGARAPASKQELSLF